MSSLRVIKAAEPNFKIVGYSVKAKPLHEMNWFERFHFGRVLGTNLRMQLTLRSNQVRAAVAAGTIASSKSAARCGGLLPLLVVLTWTFLPICVHGQGAAGQTANGANATPVPGTGHDYVNLLSETVNPAGGSVSLRIQPPMPKGRGISLPFSFAYDSAGFFGLSSNAGVVDFEQTSKPYTVGAFYFSLPYAGWSESAWQPGSYHVPGAPIQAVCDFATSFTFTDPSGAGHNLNLGDVAKNTSDGSNAPCAAGQVAIPSGGDEEVRATVPVPSDTLAAVGSWAVSGGNDNGGSYPASGPVGPFLVADAAGNTYSFFGIAGGRSSGGATFISPPDTIEDRNGNVTVFTNHSTSGTIYTDTLGRPLISLSGNTLTVSGLNYSIAASATSTAINYTVPYLSSLSASAPSVACPPRNMIVSGTIPNLVTLTLPNNQQYRFFFGSNDSDSTLNNPYGLLNEIIYPDGGWVKYTWSMSATSSQSASFAGTGLNSSGQPTGVSYSGACLLRYSTPVVATRQVSNDGVHAVQSQVFSYSTTWPDFGDWSSKSTSITTTDKTTSKSSLTTYTYAPVGIPVAPFVMGTVAAQVPVEQTITYYDWGNTTSPFETITKGWYNQFQLACEFTTLNDGQSSGHYYQYNYSQIADDKEYDFGQVTNPASNCYNPVSTVNQFPPPSNPIRETVTNFQQFTNALGTMFGKPSSVIVYGNGTRVAETDYSYDEGTVAPVSATSHDDANFGSGANTNRGNITTVTRKCLQNCADSITTYTYDQTGQVASMTDPCGNGVCSDVTGSNHTTTYSFADNFVGGNPAVATNAYLTRITRPIATSGMAHETRYAYRYQDGQLASVLDQNSKTTTYQYLDTLGRLTEVDYPDNGKSTITYNDSAPNPSVTSLRLMNSGGISITSVAVRDGMGHTIRTQLPSNDPTHSIYEDTSYDGMGSVSSVSNPYRSPSLLTDPPTGTTSYTYDALGRKLLQCQPDNGNTAPCVGGNSYLHWSYTGNTTTSYNELQQSWQSMNDGMGRLISVSEPGVLPTRYSYDALNNLTGVTQSGILGEVPRIRSFSYDSLSRLSQSYNPETGWTCYGTTPSNAPANGSNCTEGYDANSNLSDKTDASGIVTYYTYDALNRTLSRYAPDIIPISLTTNHMMTYDQGANGVGRLSQEVSYNYGTNQFISGTQFQYDAMGRVASTIWGNYAQGQAQNGTQWQPGMQVQYDLAGNVTQLTYPDSRIVSQTWDAAGHLTSVNAGPAGGGGAPYVSGMQYFPSGTLQNAIYGNGVSQTMMLNSRLQPCHQAASSPIFPSSTSGGNLMDRQLFYASPAETNCTNAPSNNGNIHNILEGVGGSFSQSFTYDALNRLTSGVSVNRSPAATYNQVYNYDSFGNMLLVDQLHASPNFGIDASTNRLTLNGDVNNGDLRYNANGTLAMSPSGIGGYHTYMYTGEGYLRGIDAYGTGSYLYDSMGERTLAVHANLGASDVAYEYVYLNHRPMADLGLPSGIWTDYIYANGQRIAKAASMDAPIHISGDNCANCGGTSSYVTLTSGAGHVIQAGDILSLTQYNVGNAGGGLMLIFTDGSYTSGLIAQDQYGQQVNCNSMNDQFLYRHIDLTAYAGKTLSQAYVGNDVCSPAGHFDQYFNDIAISSPDGAVTTIYTPSLGQVFSMTYTTLFGRGPVTNMRAVAEPNTFAAAGSEVQKGTHYYLADQVGTTQMELAGGGWPVWQGYFTPFGQEIQNGGEQLLPGTVTSDGTANRDKFTGKERDTESGLDYFGARYYASSMGRWMSPDWADRPEAVPYSSLDNPQSLNLYVYVSNNPLNKADPDGHAPLSWGGFDPSLTQPNLMHGWAQGFLAAAQQTSQAIANAGISRAGSNEYAYDGRNGAFPPGTNKCNEAVADWIEAGGAARPRVPRGGLLGRLGFTRDLTAQEWGTISIPGWSAPDSISNARPGDVIAMAHKNEGGHVGIAIGGGLSVSADALLHPAGQVAVTNWGFRNSPDNGENVGDGDRVVVRHYLGTTP